MTNFSSASWNSPIVISGSKSESGALTITDENIKGQSVKVIKSVPQKLSLKGRVNSARILGLNEDSDKVSEDAVWVTLDLIVSSMDRKPVRNENSVYRRNRNKIFIRMSVIATDVVEETLYNERDGYEYRAVTSFTAHYPTKGAVQMFTKEDSQNFGSYVALRATEILPLMFNEYTQYRLTNGRGEWVYTLSDDAVFTNVWQPEPQAEAEVTPAESTPSTASTFVEVMDDAIGLEVVAAANKVAELYAAEVGAIAE